MLWVRQWLWMFVYVIVDADSVFQKYALHMESCCARSKSPPITFFVSTLRT